MKCLPANSLKLREQLTVNYSIVLKVADQFVLNDLLNPLWWQHNASKPRQGDKIEVRTEDDLFYAELYVIGVGHLAVKVKVISAVALQNSKESEDAIKITKESDSTELPATEGYEVKWGGPVNKWCVRREGQKENVKKGCDSKEEAWAWTKEDLKAMAA